MLQLRHTTPLAGGQHRLVYQHPADPGQLVKVMRTELLDAHAERLPWYRRLARTGPYRGYVREFNEYLASLHASAGVPPLARVFGLADTDLGPGLVVEKVVGVDGGLAPNLDAWIRRDGFTREIQSALDVLLVQLLQHNVIAADLHAWNLVCSRDASGAARLVMIDGFGEKNFIPHCSMNRRHNASRTRHKFHRLVERSRATPRS